MPMSPHQAVADTGREARVGSSALTLRSCHLLGAPGTELVSEEELVRVMALEHGLVPYRGRAVSAAVWDSQAAGSIGRTGSAGWPPGGDRQVDQLQGAGRCQSTGHREHGPSG